MCDAYWDGARIDATPGCIGVAAGCIDATTGMFVLEYD